MPAILRQFLYLDERLVDQFLAQLEGGLVDEEATKTRQGGTKKAGVGGRLGPVSADIGASRAVEEEQDRVIRHTPESRFDNLHRILASEGSVAARAAFDEESWATLRRGDLIEVDVEVRRSGIENLMQITEQFNELLPLMQLFGSQVDEGAVAGIQSMTQFVRATRQSRTSTPVICGVLQTPRYQFVCHLSADFIRAGPDDILGESVLFGKVQRLLHEGEHLSAGDLMPGMDLIPRQERRSLERSLGSLKLGAISVGEFQIKWPAALVTPVAVYR